jgi:hypothetical protein
VAAYNPNRPARLLWFISQPSQPCARACVILGENGRPVTDVYVTGGQLNVTISPKPLQTYNGSVEIRLATVYYDSMYAEDIPFVFSVDGEATKVTDLWIRFRAYRPESGYETYIFDIALNGYTFKITRTLYYSRYRVISYHVRDVDALASVKEGINILMIYSAK